MDYKEAGVDVRLGNVVSEILFNAGKQTRKNREGQFGEIISPFDHFSGIRGTDISGLPEGTIHGSNSDGIGTKVVVAERLQNHSTIARDMFAMVCDDAVANGCEPYQVSSVLDVRSLKDSKDRPFLKQIMELATSYIEAAKAAGVVISNGETAELNATVCGYGEFNYNWSATAHWITRRDRAITGKKVKVGHALVGLWEKGFRSNGFSLVRRVLEKAYGEEDWHKNFSYIAEVLTPSIIYTKAVLEMFGGYQGEPKVEISGVAHITGGGIPEKLGRMLRPSGLGAEIEEPFVPCGAMQALQEIGNVDDEEAYRTWNMGQGMIIATPTPIDVIAIAKSHGIQSRIIGKVRAGRIWIKSAGYFKKGKTLRPF